MSAHVRSLDRAAIAALGRDDRYSSRLLVPAADEPGAQVSYIRTPPGGGSARGRHTHAFQQLYYVLSGRIQLEIDGEEFELTPDDFAAVPAGVPHRNWNATDEPAVHLAINVLTERSST